MLQELHGRKLLPAAQVNIFCCPANSIDDLHLLVELHPLLTVIAEADGLAHDEASAVGLHQPQQHLDESALACAVIAHDAELLVTREVVVEVLEQDVVAVGLAHILCLEYLAADVG